MKSHFVHKKDFLKQFNQDNTYDVNDVLLITNKTLIKNSLTDFKEKLGLNTALKIERWTLNYLLITIFVVIPLGILTIFFAFFNIAWIKWYEHEYNAYKYLMIYLMLIFMFLLIIVVLSMVFYRVYKINKLLNTRQKWVYELMQEGIITKEFDKLPFLFRMINDQYHIANAKYTLRNASWSQISYSPSVYILESFAILYNKLKQYSLNS